MRDYLNDIIAHTSALGIIDLVKIVGTDTDTSIVASSEDRTVIINGKFKSPNPNFIGTFGMPNLSKLKTILSFDDYDENSKINTILTKDEEGNDVPSTIHFETQNGDFTNDYRLMAKSVVDNKVKQIIFKGTTWNIEFEPSIASILRLKKQQQVHSDDTVFTVIVSNNELKIHFGDPSSHSGNFTFERDVVGTLNTKWQFPVKQVLDIFSLSGDKLFRISDQGVAEIVVDSGLATYSYLIPSHTK
jgi:hypothetical protein